MSEFLKKLCCCCSIEIGGYIVSVMAIINNFFNVYDDSVKAKRGFDYPAEFSGKGYLAARTTMAIFSALFLVAAILNIIGIKIRKAQLMILFVVLMFLNIVLPFLRLVGSKGLDELDKATIGKEVVEAAKMTITIAAVISGLFSIYLACVALGAFLSVKEDS